MKPFTNLLKTYLYKNNIVTDEQSLILHLHSNPNFPSVKSISDTLDYFKIPNVAADVPKNLLSELPTSFLAVILNDGNEEMVVVTRKKEKIKIDGQVMTKTITAGEFVNIWTGTIIAVEAADKKGRIPMPKVFVLLLGVLLLLFTKVFSSDIIQICFLIFAFTGVVLASLINVEEAGVSSRIIKRVCASINSTGGCNKVINSADSKILGAISLSTVVFAYSISELLIVTLLGINIGFLGLMGLLGLPVVLYSLYSQKFRLKQWCVLCLGVSGLYFLKLMFIGFLWKDSILSFNIDYYTKALSLMVITYACADNFKEIFFKNIGLRNEQMELYKLKKDLNIFRAVLNNSPKVNNSSITAFYEMSFGSESPVLEIDAVTNPTCGFCTEAFMVYYKLLQEYPDYIRVNLLFNVPYENPGNIAVKIASKAISLYGSGKKDDVFEELKEWYLSKSESDWLKKNEGLEFPELHINNVLTAHREWIFYNGINYTPATIIDGYLYPEVYKIEDLLLLVNDLIAEKKEIKKTLVMADA